MNNAAQAAAAACAAAQQAAAEAIAQSQMVYTLTAKAVQTQAAAVFPLIVLTAERFGQSLAAYEQVGQAASKANADAAAVLQNAAQQIASGLAQARDAASAK